MSYKFTESIVQFNSSNRNSIYDPNAPGNKFGQPFGMFYTTVGYTTDLIFIPKVASDQLSRIKGVELNSIILPPTIYNITSNNNTFLVDDIKVLVPIGLYSYTNLASKLQSLLNIDGVVDWNISTDSKTLRYTITKGGNNFIIGVGTINSALGISENIGVQITTITSNTLPKISQSPYCFLLSKALVDPAPIKPLYNGIPLNIVSKINITEYKSVLSNKIMYSNPQTFNLIDFRFTDANGIILDTNNVDFSFSLKFYL
jgi:hypothetical protein